MSIWNYHVCTVILLSIALSGGAYGQTHEAHSASNMSMHNSMGKPVEAGQSAFAAIQEIVALLDADPHTDWSKVSIDKLRSHLLDMDRLTLSASTSSKEIDGQIIEFRITGQTRTLQAIHAMVPTHAKMVREATGWEIYVQIISDGVILLVNPGSNEAFTRLKALGFFGFMTIGAHHQTHHLQMARGQDH